MPGRNEDGYDEQDNAETFDETHTDERELVGEMRTFEEMADVYDVTTRLGDRDDEEAIALDAVEFDGAFVEDDDPDEDDELQGRYHAAAQDEDDIYEDAGNPNISRFDEDALDQAESIEGLDEQVADADLVSGGEDDFTNFQSKTVNDEDLARLGYADDQGRAS